MKKSLIALSLGTLVLGIAEFVMMGILTNVATSLNLSIPTAGHFISAYALGVCFGAPLLITFRKQPPKQILLILVGLMVIGNGFAAISPNYLTMLGARFISGLPHGAYFGVASIVASKLADKGRESEAVAIMIAGMTIANLVGVPAGTFLSSLFTWRIVFIIVVTFALLTLYSISKFVPYVAPLPDTGFKGQFQFLKDKAPWLILGATTLGNGGVFAWYSYINPLLINVSGFNPRSITLLMVLAGAGMVLGNLCGGRLSSYFFPGRVASTLQIFMTLALVGIFFLASNPIVSVILMCVVTFGLFGVSSPQQYLIIKYAPGGEMLGAAGIQIAFNLGNAVGAYLGGLPIHGGIGEQYSALIGAGLTFCGFLMFHYFNRNYSKEK